MKFYQIMVPVLLSTMYITAAMLDDEARFSKGSYVLMNTVADKGCGGKGGR